MLNSMIIRNLSIRTSRLNILVRIYNLHDRDFIRCLLRQIVPLRGGIMQGQDQLADFCFRHIIADDHVGLVDGAAVAKRQRAVIDGIIEGSPDADEDLLVSGCGGRGEALLKYSQTPLQQPFSP
jgi:hypothetical protein